MFGLNKAQMITGGVAAVGAIVDTLMQNIGAKPSADVSHLWKFVNHDSTFHPQGTGGARKYGYGAAPDLVSMKHRGDGDGSTSNQVIDHIDVVNDFQWTQSPKSSRDDVPAMFLREKRIQVNPQINQIANNLFTLAEKGGRAFETYTPDELKKMIKDNKVTPENEIGKSLKKTGDALVDGMSKLTASKGSGVMAPYEQLYYTKDTGFIYTIPYMEQAYKQVNNSFGEGSGTNSMFMNIASNLTKAGANIATGFNIADPGTYIEQPQMYNFGGRDKKSYTMKFPLINTNSWNDVIRNWELIFLLIYQNTPNRLTRDLIDPPCIYEANLEGTWYSKYAYIRSMSIDFIGATRKMAIPCKTQYTPDSGAGNTSLQDFNVDTIIPDAYEITLTVEEIFSESQNMLYHSINQQNSKVSTSLAGSPVESNVPEGLNSALNNINNPFDK